jgi:RNA polymerase sigma-70 factor (ECF subfamily)
VHSQPSTHASLLARLVEGADDVAWREFHDRYHRLIRGVARRNGLQPVDADDLTQEVLAAVHRGIAEFRYDPQKGRFRGFLKTIALRAIWRRRRRPFHQQPAGLPAVDEPFADEPTAAAEQERIWEAEWRQHHIRLAMATLAHETPPLQLRAFELLVIDAQSTAAVAAKTDLAVDQLYRIKSRLLARLRELIAAQVAEEG